MLKWFHMILRTSKVRKQKIRMKNNKKTKKIRTEKRTTSFAARVLNDFFAFSLFFFVSAFYFRNFYVLPDPTTMPAK